MTTVPLSSADGISATVRPVDGVSDGIKIYSHCTDSVTKGDHYIWLILGTQSYPSYIRAGGEQQEGVYVWK